MTTTAHQTDKTAQTDKTTILVAVNDIFFYTKVRDALRANGYTIEKARTQQDIADKASSISPSIVILDMNDMALNSLQALDTLKADSRLNTIPTLAFANHEEVETWHRARALGVTKIVSRNEFSARTRELVEEVLNSPDFQTNNK